jgi:hypothetical protein
VVSHTGGVTLMVKRDRPREMRNLLPAAYVGTISTAVLLSALESVWLSHRGHDPWIDRVMDLWLHRSFLGLVVCLLQTDS